MTERAVTIPSSVQEVLDAAVRECPGAEFLADDRCRLSYGEVGRAVDASAAELVALGVVPGDRVAAVLPNRVDTVVSFLASMHVGAVWVGIHPALTTAEKEWMLSDSGALVVVTDDSTSDVSGDSVRTVLNVDQPTTERPAGRVPSPRADRGRLAAIAYTSGTTGRPKAVMHDQHHMLLPGAVILRDRMNGVGERIGTHLPLTTLNVLILGPLLALQGRGSSVCTTSRRASELATWIRDERIEHMSTSPAIVHDLVSIAEVGSPWMRGLRLGVGGASCPEELRLLYRERFGRDFTTGYGLSEAPSAVVQETERIGHVVGGSGRPMGHVDITIADQDGETVPVGEEGEICVGPVCAGPWAGQFGGMIGYWNDPTATAHARRGGLLRTGDIGRCDDDGNVYVDDRRSDMINRGGSKVSPAEVSRVLLDHPGVRDCAVVGRPDRRLGETVVAVVQLEQGGSIRPGALREHCGRSLVSYKVPSDIVVVTDIPRNAMGKVVRSSVLEIVDRGVGP